MRSQLSVVLLIGLPKLTLVGLLLPGAASNPFLSVLADSEYGGGPVDRLIELSNVFVEYDGACGGGGGGAGAKFLAEAFVST